VLKSVLDVGKDHKRVATVLFQYLFRACNKFEYRDRIGDRELAKLVWSRVVNNGYVLRNCKLFAYAAHWNRARGMSTSPAKYEIMQEDVALLRGLDLSHIPIKYKAYSLFDFNNFEGAILGSEELRTNVGKFVSKKLIFLDKHFGEPRKDIEANLYEGAVYALRKQYPYYLSDLHALNVCKTAVKNKGHGLIEYYTRGKRNKLLNENGVFQAVNISLDTNLDAVASLSVMPVHENETMQNLQVLASLDARMDERVRAFMNAARGLYDAGFTLYIGVDNTDAAHEWDYKRYMQLLRDYHLITEAQANKLLLRIRKSML
jgi:hypothetical protein